MSMKKLLALLLCLAMVLSLAACGGGSKEPEPKEETPTEEADKAETEESAETEPEAEAGATEEEPADEGEAEETKEEEPAADEAAGEPEDEEPAAEETAEEPEGEEPAAEETAEEPEGEASDTDAEEPADDSETDTEEPADEEPEAEPVTITLWTYAIGGWGDQATVEELVAGFEEANPGIHVEVQTLAYADGDDKVNTAIEGGVAPDIIMEGPERLVANWGAKGLMADLSDIWDDECEEEINAAVKAACFDADGALYEFPVVMTAHCMAINYDAFKEAGADKYVDLDTHTWTTEDFENAVAALYDHFGDTVGIVFCKDQGGDQGTRALINNLYGGTFTNAEHTAYTASSEENAKALELLAGMDGIEFDAGSAGADEIQLFYNETLKMAFCWNIAQQLNPNSAGTGEELTLNGQKIEFMSFPSETGESQLCGGIWGFGVFDNGDEARIEASKAFIKYMADSEEGLTEAVKAANYFAVRDSVHGADLSGIWADNAIMAEYTKLMPYLGDYYQVTAGWTEARAEWWNMLQRVGAGGDPAEELEVFQTNANAAAGVEPEEEAEEAVDELAEEAGEELVDEAVAAAAAALGAEEAAEEEEPEEAAEEPKDEEPEAEPVDITLWTYAIGGWGDQATVEELVAGFEEANPGIHVEVQTLAYADGDDKVNTAIEGGVAPDIIMEGPERLVANWGAKGLMADLSDIWDDECEEEINAAVKAACFDADGALYEFPVVMTAHCMAINYDAFKEAGADKYVDLDTHTWTTEDFENAVAALYDHFGDTVGIVFCKDQGGDQGTRALINNLYGGTFTNAEHTAYTASSEENAKALELLAGMDGIEFDAGSAGADEIQLFYNETLKMAFCWNIAQQLNPNSAGTGEELTLNGQKIEFMSFPSETGESQLCGGIWGFGVFDNGDEARIEASKAFIKYMADSEEGLTEAVKAANYFAVRDSVHGADLSGIWADNAIMAEYTKLMPYLGDYYQVTAGWTEARAEWWNMLQRVGAGGDPAEELEVFQTNANAAAGVEPEEEAEEAVDELAEEAGEELVDEAVAAAAAALGAEEAAEEEEPEEDSKEADEGKEDLQASIDALEDELAAASKKDEEEAAEEEEPEEAAEAKDEEPEAEPVDITLWTYAIGGWGDQATVEELVAGFEEANPGIHVEVQTLAYADGDDKVNTAIEGGVAPDIIMEGPERLVANWGAKGLMADLSDIWDDECEEEINAAVKAACFDTDGALYEFPVVMTAHCMAINYDAFKEAGADKYVDLDTHTWTTEDFENAVAALYDHFGDTVGIVFCKDQGGDQGTRALINNLYGGTFTNAEHTAYTASSEENAKALELLAGMDGIEFDAGSAGADEIQLFYNETLKMAFCWNIAQQLNPNSAGTGEELTLNGQKIEFMSFPSETGESQLCGGIWGFGVFDNGDEARIEASKAFIKYMADSEEGLTEAVKAANYFAVRDSVHGADLSGIWADNAIMAEYTKLMPYLGDYYQVTAGWTEARAEWWNMLQRVGAGGDPAEELEVFQQNANAAAGK